MSQPLSAPASAGERLVKLHDVAELIASLTGERRHAATASLDVDVAYDTGSSLSRARFDDLASRAAMVAAAGIEAVLASEMSSPAAIMLLADAIEAEIAQLETLLSRA